MISLQNLLGFSLATNTHLTMWPFTFGNHKLFNMEYHKVCMARDETRKIAEDRSDFRTGIGDSVLESQRCVIRVCTHYMNKGGI